MRRYLFGVWTLREWLVGVTYMLLLILVTLIAAFAVASGSRASSIPAPSDRVFWCSDGQGHRWRCWCDEWMRYPVCRRWHS